MFLLDDRPQEHMNANGIRVRWNEQAGICDAILPPALDVWARPGEYLVSDSWDENVKDRDGP